MIYLDNAATTMRKPREVVDAVSRALASFGGVGRGVHPASLAAGMAVFEAREAVASLLGAPAPERISFTLNATYALNCAVSGLLPEGGIAVTTAASHNSVLRPLFKARDERGCSVRIAPVDRTGALDYGAFADMVRGADLAVVTHASNVTGDVYDAALLSRIAHGAGARIVLDAAQTAGALPLDMVEIGADAVCFTGHKSLLGPQGTGGIAVVEGVEVPAFVEGGSGSRSLDERHPSIMPDSLEAGTLNAHGLAGLTAGVRYVERAGVAAVAKHEAALVARLLSHLGEIASVRVLGGGAEGRCGIVALTVGDLDSAHVAERLANEWGICTRAGAHCAPLMHRACGTEARGAVRVSFSPFSTEAEVDACADALRTIAKEDATR